MLWTVFIVAIVIVVALFVGTGIRRHRTEQLRKTFGPEYNRTVVRAGDELSAESELRERQQLREELDVHPLQPGARASFVAEWDATQAEFADDPAAAIHDADRLLQRVLRDRGYPVDDVDDPAAIVSVDHPVIVERYRRAQAITLASSAEEPDLEALQVAMQDYHAVFDELVEDDEPESAEATG
jgi:hypothetical protein